MSPAQSPLPVSDEWLSHFDTYLFGEGTYERAYEKLGAHLVRLHGQDGVAFVVWAPNAREVSVIGDFNQWDTRQHAMNPSNSGIWSVFIPGLEEYAVYKYHVISQTGQGQDKADPYGFAMEERPRTGSVVTRLESYTWQDEDWMSARAKQQGLEAPVSIYEVHLGSWRKISDSEWGTRYLSYRELTETLIPYVVEMGYTHIELLPIAEHPFEGSWGYQVLGFFAPTSRFGSPQDFMFFVDQCHAAGIGVILDWVPAHFPKDGAGLNNFDGTQLYAHSDPKQGEHQDWGTLIFNYSRNEVRSFLLSNALFWLDKYHIDGLRVDAVASMLYLDYSRKDGEWIPNYFGGRENLAAISFLQKMNEVVHGIFPGILTIAEESTSWPMVSRPTTFGGLGFSCKWNMGWMHDTLGYMKTDPLYRRYHHNQMTFGMLYAFHENFVLPLSHDEVVHGKGSLIGKMPGDEWQKFANLRSMFGYMWAYAGKKLLFMGGELAQWPEWNHDTGVDWQALAGERHRGVQRLVRDLNAVYRNQPALYEVDFAWKGFSWIEANDADNSVFSFIRFAKDPQDFLIVVCNFTPVVRHQYRIGVPLAGAYRELINTDLAIYGGSGIQNLELIPVIGEEWHSLPHSLSLVLPPLSTLILKPCQS